jgi:hypothetical protein
VLRPGLQKGGWTPKEDEVLKGMVLKEGAHNVKWAIVAEQVVVIYLYVYYVSIAMAIYHCNHCYNVLLLANQ